MNIREWTLPVFTILMQLAVGVLLALWIVRAFSKGKIDQDAVDQISRYPMLVIFITILTAMFGAHFHLSQPQFSFLAVLNFRSAWLSREITFTILVFLSTAGLLDLIWYIKGHERLKNILGWISILFGCLTIYSMGNIYLLRTQPVWNTPATLFAFYGTTVLLGAVALPLILILDIRFNETRSDKNLHLRQTILKRSLAWFTVIGMIASGVIIACNLYSIAYLRSDSEVAQTGLQLLFGLYRPLLGVRIVTALVGMCLLIYTVFITLRRGKPLNKLVTPFFLSFIFVAIGEVLGRILFYATSVRTGL